MSDALLVIKNLTKAFGSLTAVNNLSFEVKKGDIFGFLGLNGAGKSTTLKLITSLLRPDKGDISFEGLNVRKNFKKVMLNMGVLIEAPAFYNHLSGIDNIKILARMRRFYDIEHINKLFDLVGLSSRKLDKVSAYSMGMKQRLAIAQALIGFPTFVILDEPTNGLDPNGMIQIRELIIKLNKEEGITFLISSHILTEIEKTCNRFGVINKGTLVLCKNIKEVRQDKNTIIICNNPVKAGEIIRAIDNGIKVEIINEKTITVFPQPEDMVKVLCDGGVVIEEVFKEKPDLESFFKNAIL